MKGKVYLVGAGPGDPGLITKRGWDLVQRCDVVVVDDLVNTDLLQTCKADVVYVGKRGPGAPHDRQVQYDQSKINELLVHHAKQGKLVVRLKGGDPFLFGRGGEELDALRSHGIAFEVVPGVSSALAAAAYAGIPLTDRRLSSQLTFITGHEKKETGEITGGVDWNSLSPRGTLVIFMGVYSWPEIRKRLIQNRWSEKIPVAIIESATTRQERVLITTLGGSMATFKTHRVVSPSIIIVGRVVSLSRIYSWVRKEKPLLGKKIVVTRGVHQNQELTDLLEDVGAQVIPCPCIRFLPLQNSPDVQTMMTNLSAKVSPYSALVFFSANAVRIFSQLLSLRGMVLKKLPIYVVGPKTAQAVRDQGWAVTHCSDVFTGVGLVRSMGRVKGKSYLIPRVQSGPKDVVSEIKKKGGTPIEVAIYQTVSAPPPAASTRSLLLKGVDGITFTSASTVRNFVSFFTSSERRKIFSRARSFSIGPSTSEAMKNFFIPNMIQSRRSTVNDLFQTILNEFTRSENYGKK